jgi:hypothetical protein
MIVQPISYKFKFEQNTIIINNINSQTSKDDQPYDAKSQQPVTEQSNKGFTTNVPKQSTTFQSSSASKLLFKVRY